MRLLISTSAAALALIVSGCGEKDGGGTSGTAGNGAPVAAIPAPNGGDWTQIVSETADGGYRMGNPDAPVKLVEYASLGCHVCADFSTEGGETLKNSYVKSGRVSWEFRPFLLFPTDPGVTMLLRCQGTGPFFLLAEQFYADQKALMAKLQEIPAAEAERAMALPPQERVAALLKVSGIDQFFLQRGMPAAKIDACLADPAGLEKVVAITDVGTNRDKVAGTPTFLINGELVPQTSDWKRLRPALDSALS